MSCSPEIDVIMECKSEKSVRGESPVVKATTNDLVVLREVDLKKLLATQKDLERRISAHETSTEVKPASTSSAALEIIVDGFNERKKLVEQLETARAEIVQLRAQNTELLAKYQSQADENSKKLVEKKEVDNQQLQRQLEAHKKTKELFQKSVIEVYRACCELRQPRLRPLSVAGCLNCGAENHFWQTCTIPKLRSFCHVCRAIGFNTTDCPWPHSEEYLLAGDLSPSLQCKQCHRPLSEADPACDVCRMRIIEDAIQRRVEIAIEFEREKTSRKSAVPLIPPGLSQSRMYALHPASKTIFKSLSSVTKDFSPQTTHSATTVNSLTSPSRLSRRFSPKKLVTVNAPKTIVNVPTVNSPTPLSSSMVYSINRVVGTSAVHPKYTVASKPSCFRSSGTVCTVADGNDGIRPVKIAKLDDQSKQTVRQKCVILSSSSESE